MARVCYTRAEWVAMRRNGEEYVIQKQREPGTKIVSESRTNWGIE